MTLEAQTLNLSYHPSEDRLLLLLTDGETSISAWLTRALSQRLLAGIANLLWQQKDIDSSHPLAKEAALVMEHTAITQRAEHKEDKLEASTPEPRLQGLLSKIDIQYRPQSYTLLFFVGDDCIARMPANDIALHRIIDIVANMTQRAQWDLAEADFGWLSRRHASTLPSKTVGHC